jgi:plasmid stabilization system protein ParE
MRELLRRRQDEQLATRTASGIETPRTTHGRLRELRRELNALVAATHHRTGRTHGWIHNELRRICGGPPVAAANGDQLQARIEAVRSLQV